MKASHIIHRKVPVKAALLTTAIPAVVRLAFLLFANSSKTTSPVQIQESLYEFPTDSNLIWTDELSDMLATIYSSYSQFMITMLLLHLSIKALTLLVQYLFQANHKSTDEPSSIGKDQEFGMLERLKKLCEYILVIALLYTSIYCLLQAMWMIVLFLHHRYPAISSYNQKNAIADYQGADVWQQESPVGDSIQLSEDISYQATPKMQKQNSSTTKRQLSASEKPDVTQTLYSTLLTGVKSLVLSDDHKTIFATTQRQVIPINISDRASPNIMKSRVIDLSEYDKFGMIGPVMSPDSQVVAYINADTLILLDVSISPTAYLISTIHFGEGMNLNVALYFVFSPDGRTGYSVFYNKEEQKQSFLYQFNLETSEAVLLKNSTAPPRNPIVFDHLTITDSGILIWVSGTTAMIKTPDSSDFKTIFTSPQEPRMVQNVAISSDDKYAFILIKFESYYLQIVELASLETGDSSPIILNLETLKDQPSGVQIFFFYKMQFNLKGNTLFILGPSEASPSWIIDISDLNNSIPFETSLYAHDIILESNDRTAYIVDETNLIRFEYFTNMANFTGQQINSYGLVDTPLLTDTNVNFITLSSDRQTAYISTKRGVDTFRISDPERTRRRLVSSSPPYYVVLSPDDKTAYVCTYEALIIVDIDTKKTTSIPTDFNPSTPFAFIQSVIGLLDGGRVIIAVENLDIEYKKLYTIDISDPTSPIPSLLLSNITIEQFATNGRILIAGVGGFLGLYDISNPKSAVLIAKTDVSDTYIIKVVIANDNKTVCIIGGFSGLYFIILDISDPSSPTVLSSVNLKRGSASSLTVSADSNTAYVIGDSLTILDISSRQSPVILAATSYKEANFYNSNSGLIAPVSNLSPYPILVARGDDGLSIMDFKPEYLFSQSVKDSMLGQQTVNTLTLFRKNAADRYNVMDEDFKICKMSLYDLKPDYTRTPVPVYSNLLPWMTWDAISGILILQPNHHKQLKDYRFYSGISLKLSTPDFANLTDNTWDLMFSLMVMGYIDNEGYITDKFEPGQPLIMPPTYNASTLANVTQILNSRYLEVVTPVSVVASLVLDQSSAHLNISTVSQLSINVNIRLFQATTTTASSQKENDDVAEQGQPYCQFLRFSSIIALDLQNNATSITIEGPMFDINQVLSNMVVNLRAGLPCSGVIAIRDHLNKVLNVPIDNMTDYFTPNQPLGDNPDQSLSLQNQLDKNHIYTATYFDIPLNRSMFVGNNLTYTLLDEDDRDSFVETVYSLVGYKKLRSWLTLNQDLFLTGTPPNQLLPLHLNIRINVTDGFDTHTVSSSVRVHLSWGYLFSLFVQIAAVVGFYIYFNAFRNILWKRFYRYPRDFDIIVGEEVAANQIPPIALIGREVNESKIVLKQLEKDVAHELEITAIGKEQLVTFFTNSDKKQIDQNKLMTAVESTAKQCRSTQYKDDEDLIHVPYSRVDIIYQLILHEIVTRQLAQTDEALTRQTFNRLKVRWTDFVTPDKSVPYTFTINQAKLEQECESVAADSNASHESSLHILSSGSRQVNMDLLSNAIATHAFRQHNLNIMTSNINIRVYEKLGGTATLWQKILHFCKLDLDSYIFTKDSNIGFGITWDVIGDVICFAGTPHPDIKGRKIVIQVRDKSSLILRELWLNGRGRRTGKDADRSSVTVETELQSYQAINSNLVL